MKRSVLETEVLVVAARLLLLVTNRSLLSLDVILTLLDGLQYFFFVHMDLGTV